VASDPDFDAVIELERRLIQPEVRRDRAALMALLHEDFCEFGASGRVYDRDSIVEALLASHGSAASASDFKAARLGPDAVLLTYRADTHSLRTSVWLRGRDGAWRMRLHQGTPAAQGSF
jgi:ribonuclease HI